MKKIFHPMSQSPIARPQSEHTSRFGRRQSGVTMIEYALIAALIAVVLVTVLGALGTELGVTFTKIKSALTSANGG
jgi:pilus assembly protein Flp/PilA